MPLRFDSLEFWFDFKSTYSYLASCKIEERLNGTGIRLVWRPQYFDDVYAAWDVPVPHPWKGKMRQVYFDIKRRAKRWQVPLDWPEKFPVNTLEAVQVAVVALDEGWGGAAIHRIFRAYYAEQKDIGDPAVITALVDELGRDGRKTLETARRPEIREKIRANGLLAKDKGIIGAPSLVAGRDVFWGGDRMDDAVEFCQGLW